MISADIAALGFKIGAADRLVISALLSSAKFTPAPMITDISENPGELAQICFRSFDQEVTIASLNHSEGLPPDMVVNIRLVMSSLAPPVICADADYVAEPGKRPVTVMRAEIVKPACFEQEIIAPALQEAEVVRHINALIEEHGLSHSLNETQLEGVIGLFVANPCTRLQAEQDIALSAPVKCRVKFDPPSGLAWSGATPEVLQQCLEDAEGMEAALRDAFVEALVIHAATLRDAFRTLLQDYLADRSAIFASAEAFAASRASSEMPEPLIAEAPVATADAADYEAEPA